MIQSEYSLRFFRTVALVVGLPLALIGCGETVSVADLLRDASELRAEQDIAGAMVHLKSAVQKAPDNAEARYQLGLVHLELGDAASARKELQRARELGHPAGELVIPITRVAIIQQDWDELSRVSTDESVWRDLLTPKEQAELFGRLADAAASAGRLPLAESLISRSVALAEGNAMARTARARVQAGLGELSEAAGILEGLLEVQPEVVDAWSLLGDIRFRQTDLEDAAAAYGRAAELRYNNVADLMNQAIVYVLMGEYEAARSNIKVMRSRGAPQYLSEFVEGLMLLAEGSYQDAARSLRTVLTEQPDHTPSLLYLGLADYHNGNLGQAIELLSRFHSARPNNEMGVKFLAIAMLRDGRATEVTDLLRPVLERKPEDHEVLDIMAAAHRSRGEPAEAVKHLEKLVTLQPDSAPVHLNLGVNLLASGDREKGKQVLRKVTTLDADQSTEFNTVAALLQSGDYESAVELGEDLLSKHEANMRLITLLASGYEALGRREDAVSSLHRALQLKPGDPTVSDNLARLHVSSGDLEAAKEVYRDVLIHHPGDLQALMALALLSFEEGRQEQALALVERAVVANPTASQPRVALASQHLRFGDPAAALDVLEPLNPSSAESGQVLALAGRAYLDLSRFQAAIGVLRRLTELVPASAQAHYLLARAYAGAGQAVAARKALDESLERDSLHPGANLALARQAIANGQYDVVDGILERLRSRYPSAPEVRELAGGLAQARGEHDAAIRVFEQLAEVNKNTKNILNLAEAQRQGGELDAGLQTVRRWLEAHPEDVLSRTWLADTLMVNGRDREALGTYLELLAEIPENAVFHNNVAWLQRKDSPEEALEHARRAVELSSGAPESRHTLGMVLLEKGLDDKALTQLRKAYADDPTKRPEYAHHLALALSRVGKVEEAIRLLDEVLEREAVFPERPLAEQLRRELAE